MSKLLLDERPLIILPKLATAIGLNEAIFVQQIHYLLSISTTEINNVKWTYSTYDELQTMFPFWSIRTIKNVVKSLKEKGLLFVENLSKDKRDKTNYYTIDYIKLDYLALKSDDHSANVALPENNSKSCTVHSADVAPSHSADVARCIIDTKTYTKTSTKIKKNKNKKSSEAEEIISHLNSIAGTHYRPTTAKTKSLIQARLNEGFSVEDFKQVHIIKFAEWSGTDFEKFLRPETLYSNKFESYLNQKLSDRQKLNAIQAHTGLSPLELLKQQGMAS